MCQQTNENDIASCRYQELNPQNIGTVCLSVSSKWYLSHIRTFFRYAYQSGHTDRNYSGIVPLFKRPQPYPSVYTTDEILKIESSIDQTSPHGKRDYAAPKFLGYGVSKTGYFMSVLILSAPPVCFYDLGD